MDLSKRMITAEFNTTNVIPATWTNGYLEVYIGRKPWNENYANGFGTPFPMKVSNMTPFVLSFYICVEDLYPNVTFNIASDAWVVRQEVARSPGAAPGKGDLEIMVWLFAQHLQPAGKEIGEITLPMAINGTKINVSFEVRRMEKVPWGGWQYIEFKPKDWSMRCGYISYDPTIFVKAAARYATFNISDHYLLGWEIGTEWGNNTIERYCKI